MGMSTHVLGFRPPDDDYRRMRDVYRACEAAGIAVPDKVMAFFNGEPPDDAGVAIRLDGHERHHRGVTAWGDDGRSGFEVDLVELRKADPTIKRIRFYNSW